MGQTPKAPRSRRVAPPSPSSPDDGVSVWTIGHSTRTAGELIDVLRAHEIELVLDVRRFPGSRRLPHFAFSELERSLAGAGIAMKWLPSLGGRRSPVPDSPNTGWRLDAFRGYADHVATDEFAQGLFELMMVAQGMRSAVMCAEILWWRCHRRLISDVLVSLGVTVFHIRDSTAPERHVISVPARMVRGALSYAADTQLALLE